MSIQSNLENAASGLLMMSESEYPFSYFSTNYRELSLFKICSSGYDQKNQVSRKCFLFTC